MQIHTCLKRIIAILMYKSAHLEASTDRRHHREPETASNSSVVSSIQCTMTSSTAKAALSLQAPFSSVQQTNAPGRQLEADPACCVWHSVASWFFSLLLWLLLLWLLLVLLLVLLLLDLPPLLATVAAPANSQAASSKSTPSHASSGSLGLVHAVTLQNALDRTTQ